MFKKSENLIFEKKRVQNQFEDFFIKEHFKRWDMLIF